MIVAILKHFLSFLYYFGQNKDCEILPQKMERYSICNLKQYFLQIEKFIRKIRH